MGSEMCIRDRLDTNQAFDAVANASAGATVLSNFVCPAQPDGQALRDGLGPSSYGGIFGERISSPNQPPKGVMLHEIPVRIREITDGTSQTLIVSEDSQSPEGQWINGRNLFDQAFGINAAPVFENDIRSFHPGGANGCFADGHVAFLANETDLSVLAAICTRAGKETVALQ